VVSDAIVSHVAFNVTGFEYLLDKMGISKLPEKGGQSRRGEGQSRLKTDVVVHLQQ